MLWVVAGMVVLAPLDGLVMTGAGTAVVWRPWRVMAVPLVVPDTIPLDLMGDAA